MTTKKILLDIDGVMVTTPSWKKLTLLDDNFAAFDKRCTQNLNRILRETNAEIVITSSHKDSYTVEQWQAMFALRGVIPTKITLARTYVTRRQEVVNYMKINLNCVIIDDDKSLNDLPSELKERLVLTEALMGITDEKAELAIQILNSLN